MIYMLTSELYYIKEKKICCILHSGVRTIMSTSLAQLDACPTGDQEVVGSAPA